MTHFHKRRGLSLLETVISLGSAAILTVSLGASLVVASRGLDLSTAQDGQRVDSARLAREVTQDLQQAIRFTEQTATAATFLVPDRDADGDPESIRYAWSGAAGAPLTYSLNGGTSVNLASSVQTLNFAYGSQSMTAPAQPVESLTVGTKLLFITSGTTVQTSGVAASQRTATGPTILVNPNSYDRKKIDLFESWGYDVTFILPTEPSSNLAALMDQAQLVFVSAEADGSQVPSSVYDSSKGIVVERVYQFDDAHFAATATTIADTGLRVRSPSHYIMSGYTNAQLVAILTSSSSFQYFSSVGSGVTNVMGPSGRSEPAMMSLSPGDRMNNGSFANGRRVLIPWGFPGLNYDSLTTEGKAITRRCLEWAAGAGSDPNSAVQTFGNTSIFMNLLSPGIAKQVATKVSLSQSGNIQSISAFIGGPFGTVRYAIYNHNPAFNRPNALLAQSNTSFVSSSGNRWVTLAVPQTTLAPGDYWLAVNFGIATQTVNMTPSGDYVTLNYDATLPGYKNNWGTPDSQEQMSFSIYATYEKN